MSCYGKCRWNGVKWKITGVPDFRAIWYGNYIKNVCKMVEFGLIEKESVIDALITICTCVCMCLWAVINLFCINFKE